MGKNKLSNLFFIGDIGAGTIYMVAIMAILVLFASVLTKGVVPPKGAPDGEAVTIVPPQLDSGKKNLQLYTFGITTPAVLPTPTPPSGETCQSMIKPPSCTACTHGTSWICKEDPCNWPGVPFPVYDPQYTCAYQEDYVKFGIMDKNLYEQKKGNPNCIEACIAKPVIYLYPTVPTHVDVSLKIPGKIFISDPLYPKGGWKNVLAHPDGSLLYEGKKYSELFFESDVDKVNAPDHGIVIAKKDLKEKLADAITKLGLIGAEKEEFLDFWIPVLNKLDSPYILFSILDEAEKERVDHVEISPKPDTSIAFIAYFKPLNSLPENLKPLNLPANPPARRGFTAVEWGGTIAK